MLIQENMMQQFGELTEDVKGADEVFVGISDPLRSTKFGIFRHNQATLFF